MNNLIRKLAKEAGFIFWENESWKPKDAIIDWSTNYDEDLVRYTRLVVEECLNAKDESDIRQRFGLNDSEQSKMKTIEVEFSDAELLEYMKMAHEMNMTFNDFCVKVLTEYMNNEEKSCERIKNAI